MGESATTPTTQPLFERTGVYMKVVRRKGATTNFLQDSSKKNIDAAAANIEACMLQHVYDLEQYILYGNASANAYEFDGWDTFITTNRTNKASGGVVPTSLSELDGLLDENLSRQGESHKKAFIMSPKMLSKFSQLLTNVRLVQGLGQVSVEGGWRMNAYRDVPIIMSSACRPTVTMGTVTPGTGASGGTIADSSTFYFRVAPVTINGEQLASAEVSQTTGSTGNINTITLSWTAVPAAYKYKIYVGTVSGTLYCKHIIPARTYDSNGTPSVSDTDTINTYKTVTSDSSGYVTSMALLATPTTAGTEVPTAMQSDLPLIATGGIAPEYVWLIDLDEYQGLGRLAYTNEGGSRFNGLVTIQDLAITDDYLPFLIKSYCAIANSYEATSSVIRGLRVA